MIRTFIFDVSKSHWLEEQRSLLPHDICAILNEDSEIIYLWSGPKSKKDIFRKGYKQIKELISSFSNLNLQIVMTQKNFPVNIQNKVESLLESMTMRKDKILKFSRFITIRMYSILIIINIILPILLFLSLSSSLNWPISNNTYIVNNIAYDNWINTSKILTLITLFPFIVSIIIGIIEYENQVIIFSLNGLIISIGLFIYLNQGIFLFLFQEGSTLTSYLILKNDILLFLLIILIAILIFEIPNIYKLMSFFKTYRKFIF